MALISVPSLLPRARAFATGGGSRPRRRPAGPGGVTALAQGNGQAADRAARDGGGLAGTPPRGRLARAEGRGREEKGGAPGRAPLASLRPHRRVSWQRRARRRACAPAPAGPPLWRMRGRGGRAAGSMAEPLRPFRLRGCGGPQKFGVAAGSLRGLLRKGCRLLQVRAGDRGEGSAARSSPVAHPPAAGSFPWQAAGSASTRTGRS